MTKPCEHTVCPNIIEASRLGPVRFARRRFCSNRCAALQRFANGARPPHRTPAQVISSGRAGGLAAGKNRRRRVALRAAEHLARYLTPRMLDEYQERELARLKALLARAWNDGWKEGRGSLRSARKPHRRAA